MGAINVLGMAKRCRAKVLQASTSEVYGDPEVHPQPESYRGASTRSGPRACYDEGKRAAETLFMDYHRMNRVNIRIVRIFNTYGPRMHPFDGRVVSNFIRQALAGEDITIFGDGQQTRSFCYRDDLIEGMIRMMNGPDDFIGPVNLGNPDEFTIRELAELVIELTGSQSKLVHRAAARRRSRRSASPTSRWPGSSSAGSRRCSCARGSTKTIDWFRSIDLEPLPPADAELLSFDRLAGSRDQQAAWPSLTSQTPRPKLHAPSLPMHEHYMRLACRRRKPALAEDEVPVGAVIVHEGRVIAAAHNQREQLHDPTAHAEMIAITQAAEALAAGGWTAARCTSRWSRARCAPGRSSRPGFPRSSTARPTPRPARCTRSIGCWTTRG